MLIEYIEIYYINLIPKNEESFEASIVYNCTMCLSTRSSLWVIRKNSGWFPKEFWWSERKQWWSGQLQRRCLHIYNKVFHYKYDFELFYFPTTFFYSTYQLFGEKLHCRYAGIFLEVDYFIIASSHSIKTL